MVKQTSKEITEISKYIWARIKVIFLMIFLMIVVKDHPGWDVFFAVIFASQIILSILVILSIPERMAKEQRKEYEKSKQTHQNFYNHQRQKGSVFTNRIESLVSFKILDLRSTDDEETIKKQYRKLAIKWHPDRFANDTIENQDKAKRNFQKLNNAYEEIKKYKSIT